MDKNKNKKIIRTILGIILCYIVLQGIWGLVKPLPAGINYRSDVYYTDNVTFLYDLTYKKDDQRVKEQTIFHNIYELIDNAKEYVVLDMFLFNDTYTRTDQVQYDPISETLAQKLIDKKRETDIPIYFITDPHNTFYGAYENKFLAQMSAAGITVIETNLHKLRSSNPIFSGLYDGGLKYITTGFFKPYMGNVLSNEAPKVRIEDYLELLNFKANHRKVVASESEMIIASANPHDASSYHSNIAFRIQGDFSKEVVKAEKAVANMSGGDIHIEVPTTQSPSKGGYAVTLLTEKQIKDGLIEQMNRLQAGDHLDIAMFYLGERDIVNTIKKLQERGVLIRLVLDANKDAFGVEKNGIPNRQVAYELIQKGIPVRWYQSSGEQFHAKLIVFRTKGELTVFGGSANLTRRNIDNYNLEADVMVTGTSESPLAKEVIQYYEKIWNSDVYTLPQAVFYEASKPKWVLYWIQERTGLGTF